MIPDFSRFTDPISLAQYFSSQKVCKEFLKNARWSDGDIICPHCGHHHCYSRRDGAFRCPNCGCNFSVTVGTIFENTKLPLVKWFLAMYFVSSHRKGISSCQLSRDIRTTQTTAWYMLQKIRSLYAQHGMDVVLTDDVECDESYIGGRETNKHESNKQKGTQGRSLKAKTPVFGMVQRGGKVIAMKTENTTATTLSPIIRQFVKPNSRVFTDEYIGYNSLRESEYTHAIVHHRQKEFVSGEAHTNTIEGFWGQLKRMIFGTYHFVSSKYLQRYVDEAVFRYNTRKLEQSECFITMFDRSIGTFTYEDVRNVA